MKESFLHFIWMRALFNHPLKTTDGKIIQVKHPGYLNQHSGPDFLDARIILEGIQFAGNIEIHLKSSDWYVHRHHQDPAYQSVLLHVIFEHDQEVFVSDGSRLPAVVLKHQIAPHLLDKYLQMTVSDKALACHSQVCGIDSHTRDAITAGMLAKRMENWQHYFDRLRKIYVNDYRSMLYVFTFRAFGGNLNADAMEMLSGKVPPLLLQKTDSEPLHREAILFGQAGLIEPTPTSDYSHELKRIYQFYYQKFSLKPMEASWWKFHRTRPSNFPTVRIAQLAALLKNQSDLTPGVLTNLSITALIELFLVHQVSEYWQDHYTFGTSPQNRKQGFSGETFSNHVFINAWIPFLYLYGIQAGRTDLTEKAIQWLYSLKPEKNNITKTFEGLQIHMNHAAESQAFLHLYKHYCTHKKCAECHIGKRILSGKSP